MKRLFVDLSLTAQTGAGSAVLAWEFAHRLMELLGKDQKDKK